MQLSTSPIASTRSAWALEPRWVMAALAFLLCWMLAAVAIALEEPSVGWRFVPHPQGQGILAYSPQRAVKIDKPEQADAHLLALRMPTTGEVLALEALLAVEAPSMLARQEDLSRFFTLQRQVWHGLELAHEQQLELEFQTAQGAWIKRSVQERTWDELGWLFWVPLLCGVIPFVVGVAVSAWRWQSMGARFLGLASVMALLSLSEVSIVTGRLWLLPPWFAEAGQVWVRCTSLVAVWAFVMMMLYYPTPLKHARRVMQVSAICLMVLLCLNVMQWPDQITWRYKFWLVVASASLVVLALWQSLTQRQDPVHRAAARWLAVSALVSFSIVMVAFVISLVYEVQVISNSYRWVSVPLLYIGLMVSVGRTNLFELEQWWVRVCLWYLGGTLVVLTDLILVAALRVEAGVAITVSLLVIGWLYFPLRQWLLDRLEGQSRPRLQAYWPDLIGAINAGWAGEQAARQAWRDLLAHVFQPKQMQQIRTTQGAGGTVGVQIDDAGRVLIVPDVGGYGWRLMLAQQGKQLFTPAHVQVASQLWQMLDLGLHQQQQTLQAVERERQRIAADLHDDLGARLLSLAQTTEHSGVAQQAREALSEMRQSVRGMAGQPVPAPHAWADWRAECSNRLDAAGIEIEWHADDPPATLVFPPHLHLQLTRLLREATTNVLRHSRAQRCLVQLHLGEEQLDIAVHDDGRGWSSVAQQSEQRKGLGLTSIERRARQLGGVHRFESSEVLGGACVKVSVPMMKRG